MNDPMISLLEEVSKDGWTERLSSKPYSIKIKKHPTENLYMFSYNMLETDFSNRAALACRGSILSFDDGEPRVVCYALSKFFNEHEPHAARVKGETARAFTKIDGSLIKLFYYDGIWRWATNNGFDAEADLPGFLPVVDESSTRAAKTFQDLISAAFDNAGVHELDFLDELDEDYTYWFELTSPRNRIVIPYQETRLWFLGCRNNRTLEERDPYAAASWFSIPFEVPQLRDPTYVGTDAFKSERGTEGVVLVDDEFNRVKVKTSTYVLAHRIKGEQQLNEKHLFESVKDGVSDDICGLFPEYAGLIDEVKKKYSSLLEYLAALKNEAKSTWSGAEGEDEKSKKKAFAGWAMSPRFKNFSQFLFSAIKNDDSFEQLIDKIDYGKFLELTTR